MSNGGEKGNGDYHEKATGKSSLKYPKWQAYSGIAFSTFTSLHLFNHFVTVFGDKIDNHMRWTTLFRKYYQSPLVETGLATALIVHIYCAAQQIKSRVKLVPEGLPLSHKLHRYSGYFLGTVILGHIYAVRLGPIRFFGYKNTSELDSTFISWTLKEYGIAFYTYYTLLFASGLYHSLFGLYHSAWILKKQKPVSQYSSVWKWIAALSVISGGMPFLIIFFNVYLCAHIFFLGTGLAVFSLSGERFPIDIPKDSVYKALEKSLFLRN
ncbi:hypothetical protein RFI_21493 [Reticulomyxa filosa]|uniref:Mitochondrial adapter protein MCP1 transmembrane domain-containing protein n=1 Tax=Reticulomyxa filosa TaxID=46433 RepID=X6MPY3_RETFI|nr:hypothetical protein RFI_21493 [Reticulomyxa filosa]|eukprot:ETO15874.1 hypothetical protein RFI_21493 [Reticulomyxa filosa]